MSFWHNIIMPRRLPHVLAAKNLNYNFHNKQPATFTSFRKLLLSAITASTLAAVGADAQVSKSLESPRKEIIYFDLPAQPLTTGLIEFALQSSLTIIADSHLIEGLKSQPLSGPLTPIDALKIFLANTSLSFRFDENIKSIVIIPAPDDADSNHDQPLRPPAEIDEIQVTGIRYPFDYNTISNTQIYGTTSVFNAARFISVLPENLLRNEAPVDVADALKLSSGITPGDGLADSNDDFYIRGFPRIGTYLDGTRLSAETGVKLSPATIDRIEILKGPSTIFYGQAEPGGIVNVVRKKPMHDTQQSFAFTAGDGNKQQASLDVTGEAYATSNNQWLYRFIAEDDKQDKYRDLNDIQQQLLAPSVSVAVGKNTLIDLDYTYQRDQQSRPQGTIVVAPLGQSVDVISIDEPAHQERPDFSSTHRQFDFGIQHFFASGWSLKANFSNISEERLGIRTARNALLTGSVLPSGNALDPEIDFIILDGISIPITVGTNIHQSNGSQALPVATIRSIFDETGEENTRYFKTLLDGSFSFMGLPNDLSLGADWYGQRLEETITLEHRSDISSLTESNNSANANYLVNAIINNSNGIGTLSTNAQTLRYDDYGIFFLDNVQLTGQWKISLGGRGIATTGELQSPDRAEPLGLPSYHYFASELGLRYEPIEKLSLYANYSEGMKTNYQIDDMGTQITEPETSNQFELGSKMLLLDGRLISTIAAYKIDKQHVVNIEFNEGFRHAVLGGEQRTSGVDMDLTYQINSAMSLLASASFMSPEISTGPNTGNVPSLASKQVASGFFSYSFKQGWAKGLSLSAGGYYVGSRFVDNENTARIDPFTTFDLGATYDFTTAKHGIQLQLSAKNIADKQYTSASEGFIRRDSGAGRSLLGTIRLTL